MTTQRIDLYEYFQAERKDAKNGYLCTYCHRHEPEYGAKKLRPAMLVIPGGGYEFVSYREHEEVALRFFAAGYDVFVLEYDIKPVAYPAQLLQAAMAMLYIRREAKNLWILEDKIAACGFSAGGHLCGAISFLYDDPAVKKVFGKECEKVKPDASVFAYSVVTSDPAFWHEGSIRNFSGKEDFDRFSLEKHVRADASPCFLWATTTDDCVPVENSLLLYGALHKAGVPVEMHLFENGPHGMSTCDEEVYMEEAKDPTVLHVGRWVELSLEFLALHGFKQKFESLQK